MCAGILKISQRFLAVCCVALPNSIGSFSAMASELEFNDVLNPELTRIMINSGGFEITDAGDGSIIAIQENKNVFDIFTRFLVWDKNDFEGINLIDEVLNDDISCTKYFPQNENFKPIETCRYSVELTQHQIDDLAYGKALVNEFFESIDQIDAIPAIGGQFITNPIQVNTFNLNKDLNRILLQTNARLWMNCWNADPYSDNFTGFKISSTTTNETCKLAKLEYRKTNTKIKSEALLFSRMTPSSSSQYASLSNVLHKFANNPHETWGNLLEGIRN